MSYITANTPENNNYFLLFTRGDATGLSYVYDNLYKPIFFYARRIIEDPFEIDSILQDSFLRAWDFRARVTSMLHLFRFIRMRVRWGCYSYLNEKRSKFQRSLMPLDFIENSNFCACDPNQEKLQDNLSEKEMERLALLENAIPYLPVNKQTILRYYLNNRLTYREIAQQFAASYQHISTEMQESIVMLKSMLVASSQDNLFKSKAKRQPKLSGHMTDMQVQIYNLRHHKKYNFERIAQEINSPLPEVINQYISANQILKTLNKYESTKNRCYA